MPEIQGCRLSEDWHGEDNVSIFQNGEEKVNLRKYCFTIFIVLFTVNPVAPGFTVATHLNSGIDYFLEVCEPLSKNSVVLHEKMCNVFSY